MGDTAATAFRVLMLALESVVLENGLVTARHGVRMRV